MPANTGFGTLTIGKDISIDVTLPNGTILDTARITSFDKKQMTTHLSSKGMDGLHRHAEVPDGWQGTITLDRAGPAVDNFFAALEATYYATGLLNPVRITETIQDTDGTITQFRYEGCSLKLSEGGSSTSDKYVSQKIDFMASVRKKVL